MKKAYIFAGIAILFWSTMATISKVLLNTLDNFQVLCISSLFAFIITLVINIFSKSLKELKKYKIKDYAFNILIGLPGTFFYYVFYYAGAAKMPASQAFIVNYLWPIMSVVFACIILKEKLTIKKAIAFALSFVGIIIVTGGDLLQFNQQIIIGAALCMLGAVSYGLFTALNQKATYTKSITMMISFFSTFILTLIICIFSKKPLDLSAFQILGLAWNGLATMAVGTTAWALALSFGNTAKISNLAYITPFLSLIWTGLILKEKISIMSVVGLCVIILGIFIQLKDKKSAVQ